MVVGEGTPAMESAGERLGSALSAAWKVVIYSEEQVGSVDRSSMRGNIRGLGGGEPLAKQTFRTPAEDGPCDQTSAGGGER